MAELSQHYVEFFFPGALAPETEVETVEERDHEKVDVPENAFGFRYFDRTVIKLNDQELQGDRRDVSGTIYPGGEVIPSEEISKNPDDYSPELVNNVERDGYDVVETRLGGYKPFEDDDKVI